MTSARPKSKKTYFWLEVVRRGGGIGVRVFNWMPWPEMGGKEICFFARGGAGGRFRSDDEDMFERVSSLELLLLLLMTKMILMRLCSANTTRFLPLNWIALMHQLKWKRKCRPQGADWWCHGRKLCYRRRRNLNGWRRSGSSCGKVFTHDKCYGFSVAVVFACRRIFTLSKVFINVGQVTFNKFCFSIKIVFVKCFEVCRRQTLFKSNVINLKLWTQ